MSRPAQHIAPPQQSAVEVNIFTDKGKVIYTFTPPVQNLQMSPEEAVNHARALLQGAAKLKPDAVAGFSWQKQ